MKRFLASLCIVAAAAGSALAQSVTVTSSATTYGSVAGQITLTVNFNFATPTSAPTAMAFEITAPAGWSYGGGYSGDIPAAKPVTGATGPLGFAFSDFDTQTPGKVAFSFKVNYDAGLSGTQTFPVTVAQYKDGVVGTVNLTVPNITFTSASGGTVAVPVISSATTASATVGAAFSYTITATNTPSSFAATGLPAGLSLNTTTG
ncbi:MAG: putative Ig domain-containing protein, partial [Opitutaceae bacterium]